MKANMPENAQDRAAFTYNAAADFFDASPLSFWDYFDEKISAIETNVLYAVAAKPQTANFE